MREGKVINWLNIGLTFYIHLLVLHAILETIPNNFVVSTVLATVFVCQTILYYRVYWLLKSKVLKREYVLISGLIFALFLFKGGYVEGLYYVGIMLTSSFFIKRTRVILLLQGLVVILVLNIPFRYTLSPFAVYSDSLDWATFFSILTNFIFVITAVWASTYYLRLNVKLMAMQKENEEAVKILERQRIAQEIHDAIGHGLTSLNMHLEYGMSLEASDYEKIMALFCNMKGITEEAIYNCRRSVKMLKEDEPAEQEFGLETSLDRLKNSVEQGDGIQITARVNQEVEQVPDYVKSVLFTSIREALTNAIKYSGSQCFEYVIENKDNGIELNICDFGVGAGSFSIGNGLRGIKERVDALSGTIQFYDDAVRGFCIDINLPKE